MIQHQNNQYMVDTYLTLRRGMAIIAILFPFALILMNTGPGGEIQVLTSISAHYYIDGTNGTNGNVRDLFVGVLFMIGACLVLYKGPPREDYALTIAGVSAILVAFFEMTTRSDCDNGVVIEGALSPHGFFAILFFLAISFVCIFLSKANTNTNDPRHRKFIPYYRWCAAVMVVCMIAAFLAKSKLLPVDLNRLICEYKAIFWIESIAIWAFSAYWFIKTIELDQGISWVPSQVKFWKS